MVTVMRGVISTLTGITQKYSFNIVTVTVVSDDRLTQVHYDSDGGSSRPLTTSWFCQSTLFPGTIFLISGCYKRCELTVRTTRYLSRWRRGVSTEIESLFTSGILTGIQGKLGQASWSFPYNTRWLTQEARLSTFARLADDDYGRMDGHGSHLTAPAIAQNHLNQQPKFIAEAFISAGWIQKYQTKQELWFIRARRSSTTGYDTTVMLLLAIGSDGCFYSFKGYYASCFHRRATGFWWIKAPPDKWCSGHR
ncbi:hypothetical protein BD769DRAFT_1390869 [Suillus cothurnatus]|nr:hypothetical protein BD769DRAFT_1390869 [Suillus cothurnatus]